MVIELDRERIQSAEPIQLWRTLQIIGRKFKVTRERSRQIQALAITKLRRHLESLDPHGWRTEHAN